MLQIKISNLRRHSFPSFLTTDANCFQRIRVTRLAVGAVFVMQQKVQVFGRSSTRRRHGLRPEAFQDIRQFANRNSGISVGHDEHKTPYWKRTKKRKQN